MSELPWKQRLRNAIYQIKFSQMPGVHNNGIYEREMDVDEALDNLAEEMGIDPVKMPKFLYWIEDGWLYSRVTSRAYPVSFTDKVWVRYEGEWYECAGLRAAINFINMKELKEAPTEQPIIDGYFEYQGD